jgi:hypothetical protein
MRVSVNLDINANARRVLHKYPDITLLQYLAEYQRIGSAMLLVQYLADCREDLHARMEKPGVTTDELRALSGACATLSDLVGLFSQPRQLLEAMNK